MITKEWVIDTTGRIFVQSVSRDEIDPGDALAKVFTNAAVTKFKNLLMIDGYGPVSVACEPAAALQWWTVPVQEIVFKSTFTAFETPTGPEMVPSFHKNTDEPMLTIPWNVNDATRGNGTPQIRFVAQVQMLNNGRYRVHKQFLYAFSTDGNAHHMPLANLYDTGEICAGEFNSDGACALESLLKALEQWRTAPYNSDLYDASDASPTAKFFHFKPLEKGFKTLPIVGNWWTLCDKISSTNIKYVIL